MEYSQIILNYMESVGVTGYKLSKATGISESLFGKWKAKPTSKIDATTLKKISDYFGMSIDALIGNEQKNKPSAENGELYRLNPREKELLRAFRKRNKDVQDAALRTAGVDPDNIPPEPEK